MIGQMRRLTDFEREAQALCLGARTQLDDAATGDLGRLVAGGLDWARLWELGDRHDVLPLLAESLPLAAAWAGSPIPPEFQARATRRRHVTLVRNGRMAETLQRVLDGLAAVDVPVIPVKGLVLTDELYDSLGARGAADLDILVRTPDLDAARGVLAAQGYRRHDATFTTLTHEFHDPPYLIGSGTDTVRLELHRDLWADRFFRSDLEGLWARARMGTFLGRPARLLTLEDTLIHLAIHRSRSPLKLRWNCDIAELIRRHGSSLDWDAIVERTDRIGARTATWVVLSMADRFLGASPPPGTLERFRVGRAKRAFLERTCGADATLRSVPTSAADQTPHLTLRVFEQDGAAQIARALGSSLRRSTRRILHDSGVHRVGHDHA
jgi:hypothetical protein